jgi:hypothetical protein
MIFQYLIMQQHSESSPSGVAGTMMSTSGKREVSVHGPDRSREYAEGRSCHGG